MVEEGRGLRGFGRDVLVNVIANLVAGAIIYLLAAATGLLPRKQLALVAAWTTLVTTFAVLAMLYFGIKRWVIRRGWQNYVKAIGLGAGAMYMAVCWIWIGMPWRDGGWVFVLFFAGMAVSSARFARSAWEARGRPSAITEPE